MSKDSSDRQWGGFGYPPHHWKEPSLDLRGKNPPGWKSYWGARAIYEGSKYGYMIDLLPDRQTWVTEEKNSNLEKWLNEYGIKWLKEEVKDKRLLVSEPQEIRRTHGNFELRANTNGSFGYLYIGALQYDVPSHKRIFIVPKEQLSHG